MLILKQTGKILLEDNNPFTLQSTICNFCNFLNKNDKSLSCYLIELKDISFDGLALF